MVCQREGWPFRIMNATKRKCLAGLAIFCLSLTASLAGEVNIRLHVTAVTSALGYSAGENYQFTFTVVGDFSSPQSTFSEEEIDWRQQLVTPRSLWDSFAGSFKNGGGGYTPLNPNNLFSVSSTGLDFTLRDDASIGVWTLDNSPITWVHAFLDTSSYTASSTEITPEAYFAGYPNPAITGGDLAILSHSTNVGFEVISAEVEAVPEPSTGLLVAGGILAGLILRQGRKHGKRPLL